MDFALGNPTARANSAAVLDAGRIVAEGPGAELFRKPIHPCGEVPVLRRKSACPGAIPGLYSTIGIANPACSTNSFSRLARTPLIGTQQRDRSQWATVQSASATGKPSPQRQRGVEM